MVSREAQEIIREAANEILAEEQMSSTKVSGDHLIRDTSSEVFKLSSGSRIQCHAHPEQQSIFQYKKLSIGLILTE